MQTKILVLMIAAGCFAAGYYTRVVIVDDRHDALARELERHEAYQKKMYADMDRILKTQPVLDGSDYKAFQKSRIH